MAEAQEQYDFHMVLDAVWEILVDDLELDPVLKDLEVRKVFRRSEIRDLRERHSTTTEKVNALLQLVRDGDHTQYEQFKRSLGDCGQEDLVKTIEAAEKGEYKSAAKKEPRTEQEKLLKVLKEDLIAYYRERESTISVAPLVEQHDAEITKFYVRPPMIAYNKPNAFGQKKQSEENSKKKTSNEKTCIRSYRELLLKDSDRYRGIYVTADAGMGKTSFAKMLAITWCEAHTRNVAENCLVEETSDRVCNNEKSSNTETRDSLSVAGSNVVPLISVSETEDDAFSDTDHDRYISTDTDTDSYHSTDSGGDSFTFTDDFYTLEIFEYLFLIKLRECPDKCMLDDMILEMMKSKLKHKTSYTEEFLEKVLCKKRCLIIVDGLDEWLHLQSCPRGGHVPHRRAWPECTVLTTTRPWKLSTAQLAKADIDRQVEISELDETTARELESRAIEFLNENQRQNSQMAANSETKTLTGFKNSVPKTILGHIIYIPFLLLQMICLWFGNNPIGKSLCEVYSNIIELTLTRWLVKTDSGHTDCECEPSKEHENIKLKCMENNRHCQRYMPLLEKIGELAFSTLFDVIREESLLFDKEQVLKYLRKEELKQCLDMGLLSQVKDTTCIAKVRLQLYFPHKTLHEYFCALFIVTNWNNTNTGTMSIKQTISNKCTSVSDILEMSEVFVFVCGLNPEVYSDISRHLATIVSTDQSVIDYRNSVEEFWYPRLLWEYQRMQISCFLESTRNQHPECKIVLEDMIIEGWFYDHMEEDEEQACKSFLTSSAHTLKYLRLEYVSLTDDTWSAISTLNNLHVLYLNNVDVSSDSLNAVSGYISGCMSLQKLRLDFRYKPSDTDEKSEHREASINYLLRSIEAKTMLTYLRLNDDVVHQNRVLDLSKHNKLQELDLFLPLTELHINTEQLVKCEVYKMDGFSAAAVSSLLAELHGAPVLKTLALWNISNHPPRIDITALPLLTEFTLQSCDLRDSTVTLTLPLLPEFTLRECDLRDSTVTLTLPLLTEFTLEECDLRDSTVTLTLPLLTEFTLYSCDLRDSTVTLSPEMTSLETITLLRRTTVNIPGYRELFLSISKLPKPITVKLVVIKMTAGEWRELLFDILGKLPKSIHVEMEACSGPSEEEWRNIFDDMKASPAFCVASTDYKVGGWERGAHITFDTVVV